MYGFFTAPTTACSTFYLELKLIVSFSAKGPIVGLMLSYLAFPSSMGFEKVETIYSIRSLTAGFANTLYADQYARAIIR